MKYLLILAIAVFTLSSCQKEEEIIPEVDNISYSFSGGLERILNSNTDIYYVGTTNVEIYVEEGGRSLIQLPYGLRLFKGKYHQMTGAHNRITDLEKLAEGVFRSKSALHEIHILITPYMLQFRHERHYIRFYYKGHLHDYDFDGVYSEIIE